MNRKPGGDLFATALREKVSTSWEFLVKDTAYAVSAESVNLEGTSTLVILISGVSFQKGRFGSVVNYLIMTTTLYRK